MGDLVEALLDVSRITSGRLELRLEEVELSTVAEGAVERWREAACAADAPLRVVGAPVRGRWDRLRLEQVLNNLLSNALKYGRGKPIEVRARVEDDRAVLEVQDHGIGIAPTDHARIFERWGRAVSAKNYGGLGLGLWIAAQIVAAMRGSISVQSAPGQGATFRVSLPLGEAP